MAMLAFLDVKHFAVLCSMDMYGHVWSMHQYVAQRFHLLVMQILQGHKQLPDEVPDDIFGKAKR